MGLLGEALGEVLVLVLVLALILAPALVEVSFFWVIEGCFE
jgi:hypothetical protein